MKTAFQTNIGRQRSQNQDRVAKFISEQGPQLAVVADGIGGNQRGDLAAEMTIKSLGRDFIKNPPSNDDEATSWLTAQVQSINNQVLKKSKQKSSYQGMGTTLVAAIFYDHSMVVANIGDSRGYIMHDGLLTQITIDHSLVNELVKNGDLTEQEAARSPQKNIITRAIGISTKAEADVNCFPFNEGDQLLLCTDGLSNLVDNNQLTKVLNSSKPLDKKCSQLVKMANKAGGPDNITVLISQKDQERL